MPSQPGAPSSSSTLYIVQLATLSLVGLPQSLVNKSARTMHGVAPQISMSCLTRSWVQVVPYDLLVGADGRSSVVQQELARMMPPGFCRHIEVRAEVTDPLCTVGLQGCGSVSVCAVAASYPITLKSHD